MAISTNPVLPYERLKWAGGFSLGPVWPSEPNISAIRSLALKALPSKYFENKDPSLLQVQFFAQGGFNKIYEISHPVVGKKYLLRVTLPVDPFFKTESEVATIEFLRQSTTIPLTRVIAWNSSSKNILGYEWVLMEKVEGIPAGKVWRTMPWEAKVNLSRGLGECAVQLRRLPFDKIGSIFFEDVGRFKEIPKAGDVNAQRGDGGEGKHSFISLNDIGPDFAHFTLVAEPSPDDDYVIGRMVSVFFFEKNRLHSSGNRGPFRNSYEYMAERIKFQLNWIDTGLNIAHSEDPNDADSWCDKDFIEEAPDMRSTCNDALTFLPNLFPAQESNELPHILHHHDLNPGNILVDPATYAITGIIDWEMTCVLPRWEATAYPKLFHNIDPLDEIEPPIPVDYEDKEDYNIIKRDRWDARNLRRVFDETLTATTIGADPAHVIPHTEYESFEKKKSFDELVYELGDHWRRARFMLEDFRDEESSGEEDSDSGEEDMAVLRE